jgi:hypothetical protein
VFSRCGENLAASVGWPEDNPRGGNGTIHTALESLGAELQLACALGAEERVFGPLVGRAIEHGTGGGIATEPDRGEIGHNAVSFLAISKRWISGSVANWPLAVKGRSGLSS